MKTEAYERAIREYVKNLFAYDREKAIRVIPLLCDVPTCQNKPVYCLSYLTAPVTIDRWKFVCEFCAKRIEEYGNGTIVTRVA